MIEQDWDESEVACGRPYRVRHEQYKPIDGSESRDDSIKSTDWNPRVIGFHHDSARDVNIIGKIEQNE